MAIISAMYAFHRDPLLGFGSRNRVSTDACAALWAWREAADARDFEEISDPDDEPAMFRLFFDENDDSAGPALDGFCANRGVTRHFQP